MIEIVLKTVAALAFLAGTAILGAWLLRRKR